MNGIVVDTSVWVDYLAGEPIPLLDRLLAEGQVHLPPIVIAELMSGRMPHATRTALTASLGELPMCETPYQHWVRVGQLRESLARKGIQVSVPDAHVAQCAIDLEGGLITTDRVFDRLIPFCPLRLISGASE